MFLFCNNYLSYEHERKPFTKLYTMFLLIILVVFIVNYCIIYMKENNAEAFIVKIHVFKILLKFMKFSS